MKQLFFNYISNIPSRPGSPALATVLFAADESPDTGNIYFYYFCSFFLMGFRFDHFYLWEMLLEQNEHQRQLSVAYQDAANENLSYGEVKEPECESNATGIPKLI